MSKNHNISIDEGIEKLRSLTISEKNKNNNIKNEKSTEKKNRIIYNNINKNININLMTNSNNTNDNQSKDYSNYKNYKRKRNYLSLINGYNKSEIANINSNSNSNKQKDKNIINNDKIEENTLLDVEALSTELLKCKNEEELKKVLFHQLLLLDQKKRNCIKYEELKESTNILEKDKCDLFKCIEGVSRVLNKKVHCKNDLDLKIKELEGEISKLNGSINYYQSLGDFYKNELDNLKQIYY